MFGILIPDRSSLSKDPASTNFCSLFLFLAIMLGKQSGGEGQQEVQSEDGDETPGGMAQAAQTNTDSPAAPISTPAAAAAAEEEQKSDDEVHRLEGLDCLISSH